MATQYAFGKIITDGLVLALDAADKNSYPGSGTTWRDLSSSGNTGTLTNGPTFSNNSIVFDGVNDHVPLSSTVNLGNTFTILSWIKPSTLAGGDYIVYGLDANGGDNWFGINGNAVNIFATQAADVNNFTLTGGSITSTDTWYFIGCTVNGSTAKVYLNGIEQNSVTQAFTIGSWNASTTIGRRGSLDQRYFPGSISAIQTYNRVLLSSEIKQNYNAQKSRFNL